jgi:hypothetical protein
MADKQQNCEPEEGPCGVDRWTSNGYGLTIDGAAVASPAEKEARNGNQTQEHAADEC